MVAVIQNLHSKSSFTKNSTNSRERTTKKLEARLQHKANHPNARRLSKAHLWNTNLNWTPLISKYCHSRSGIGCSGVNASQNAVMEQKSAPERSLHQNSVEAKIAQHWRLEVMIYISSMCFWVRNNSGGVSRRHYRAPIEILGEGKKTRNPV